MAYDLKITRWHDRRRHGRPGRAGRRRRARRHGRGARRLHRTRRSRRSTRPDRIVTPGFVDIHTHYDAQILWDRMLTVSPWHGVTTVVMGNCGFGVAPTLPEHRDLIVRTLEKVEGMSADGARSRARRRVAVRDVPRVPRRGRGATARRSTSAAMVGHTPVRLSVMGEEATERAATTEEIAAMRARRGRGARRRARSDSPRRSRRPTSATRAGRCRAAWPTSPRSPRSADVAGRCRAGGHAGHDRPGADGPAVRRDRRADRPAGRAGPRCWPERAARARTARRWPKPPTSSPGGCPSTRRSAAGR